MGIQANLVVILGQIVLFQKTILTALQAFLFWDWPAEGKHISVYV